MEEKLSSELLRQPLSDSSSPPSLPPSVISPSPSTSFPPSDSMAKRSRSASPSHPYFSEPRPPRPSPNEPSSFPTLEELALLPLYDFPRPILPIYLSGLLQQYDLRDHLPLELLGVLHRLSPNSSVHRVGENPNERQRFQSVVHLKGWFESVGSWRRERGARRDGWRDPIGDEVVDAETRRLEDLVTLWLSKIGPLWLHHLPSLLLPTSLDTRDITLATHARFEIVYPDLLAHSLHLLPTPSLSRQRNALGTLFVASSLTPIEDLSSSLDLPIYISQILAYIYLVIHSPAEVWIRIGWADSTKDEMGLKQLAIKQQRLMGKESDNVGASITLTSYDEKSLGLLHHPMSGELEEMVERIRFEGLAGLSWLIRETSWEDASDHQRRIFSSSRFWTCLSPTPTLRDDGSSFGAGNTQLRRVGWRLLKDLLSFQPGLIRVSLAIISFAVLRSCWLETDEETLETMWEVVPSFLQTFPESWMLEHTASRDPLDAWSPCNPESILPCTSRSFENLLALLQKGGTPGRSTSGTSILVDVLQTIPRHIFPFDTQSVQSLFDALWSSYPCLLNSSLHPGPVKSLLFTIQSCNTYLLEARLAEGTQLYLEVQVFADEQVERCRREAGEYVVEAAVSRRGADAAGGGMVVDDDEEVEFEDYGYDEEEEEEDEGDEEGDGLGDVDGDRLSGGSGAEERDEETWDGEERLAVRGRDLAFELGSHPRPNLLALRITSTLPSIAVPSLLSLFSSGLTLRHLDLSQLPSSSYSPPSTSSIFQLFTHFLSESSTSSIHHLSLPPSPSSPPPGFLETSLLSLLTLDRSGLEYLDLRGTSTFTTEESLTQLVECIEDSNPTLQMLWLDPRTRWTNTPLSYLRDRLNDALGKNRARRKLCQATALRLVGRFRAMLCLGRRGRVVGTEKGRLESLPTEVLREILRYSSSSGLSRRQVGRVMSWAEERGTLMEVGAREFLERVDCWKFELEE